MCAGTAALLTIMFIVLYLTYDSIMENVKFIYYIVVDYVKCVP